MRNRRGDRGRASRALPVWIGLLLVAGLGCASLLGGGPRRLIEEGKAAVDKQDLPTAYERFKQVEVDYPESDESGEAYYRALACFQPLYNQHRHTDRSSVWVASEPTFLYGWLARRIAVGDGEEAARALFLRMPWSFYQGFQAYAEGRPELAAYRIVAEEDNGIIEMVELKRP